MPHSRWRLARQCHLPSVALVTDLLAGTGTSGPQLLAWASACRLNLGTAARLRRMLWLVEGLLQAAGVAQRTAWAAELSQQLELHRQDLQVQAQIQDAWARASSLLTGPETAAQASQVQALVDELKTLRATAQPMGLDLLDDEVKAVQARLATRAQRLGRAVYAPVAHPPSDQRWLKGSQRQSIIFARRLVEDPTTLDKGAITVLTQVAEGVLAIEKQARSLGLTEWTAYLTQLREQLFLRLNHEQQLQGLPECQKNNQSLAGDLSDSLGIRARVYAQAQALGVDPVTTEMVLDSMGGLNSATGMIEFLTQREVLRLTPKQARGLVRAVQKAQTESTEALRAWMQAAAASPKPGQPALDVKRLFSTLSGLPRAACPAHRMLIRVLEEPQKYGLGVLDGLSLVLFLNSNGYEIELPSTNSRVNITETNRYLSELLVQSGSKPEAKLVGIIDDDYDQNHPAIGLRLINVKNENKRWNLSEYINPHGSHVAGLIVDGNPWVQIKTCMHNEYVKTSYQIKKLVHNGVTLINMSFVPGNETKASDIESAINAYPNVLFITGVRNVHQSTDYFPEWELKRFVTYPNVLIVGFVQENGVVDQKWGAYGPDIGLNAVGRRLSVDGFGSYVEASGSSDSIGHITGLIAAMRVLHPDITMDETKQILKNASVIDPRSQTQPDMWPVQGVVNDRAALREAAILGILRRQRRRIGTVAGQAPQETIRLRSGETLVLKFNPRRWVDAPANRPVTRAEAEQMVGPR